MKCAKCGELIEGFALRCPVCGTSLTKDTGNQISSAPKTVINPVHTHGADCSSDAHPGMDYHAQDTAPRSSVGFWDAIRLFFRRYADFRGRSRRSEYWWATLFVYGLNMGLSALSPELGSLLTLVLFVPCLALCIRRLHDAGRSGWWYVLIAVPFGALVLLYFFCKDSDADNKWGPNPKY